MVRYGVSTGLELDQAKSLVYTASADVAQYSRALAQAQLSLATLLGETPQPMDEKMLSSELTIEDMPTVIPAGIPSDLLRRRPDIMESYYALQAASARVGIARSNRFPSISITGSGGVFGSTVKELFADGHWKWGATGGLAQPLFNFGSLRNREKMAIVAYKEAVEEFEQTILTALEEVESALVAIATYRTQAEEYAQYVKANGRIAQLTEALYSMGMYDYLDVISTEQTWYESQLQMVNIVAQQYINYANLVMALGDGWQGVVNDEK
jgi:multidrug efflux system outer membrane protein